jgi:signal transduction histidine kinase
MQILVAEDDFVSRGFLKKILESFGHKCLVAENGLEAWDLFQKNDTKFVISDWMMPKMDGITLCRKIREKELPHYVYFIILTSQDRKEDTVAGLKAGADDYIIKPFEPEELKARIHSGQRIIQLEENYKNAHTQLLQSEKMASIGQLAAGVAHEINNPVGFVSSNLKTMSHYRDDISTLIKQYRSLTSALKKSIPTAKYPVAISEQLDRIANLETELDIDYVLNDISDLVKESREGTDRIKKIVLDLKDFAHPGEDKPKFADINRNMESTLNVVWNELKYKARVVKKYGDLPQVKCYPQQLNQVFVNLLVNAAQAIEKQGEIKINTRALDGKIEISIMDTGSGIAKEHLSKIFDPFFTTKDVGKGTGLGLNVAYNIIQKHKGTIDVESEVGKGTTFIISLQTEPDI